MPRVFVQRGPLAAELGAGSGRSRGRAAPVSLSCYSLIGGSDPAFQYWNSAHLAAKAGTGCQATCLREQFLWCSRQQRPGASTSRHLVPHFGLPLSLPLSDSRSSRLWQTAACKMHWSPRGILMKIADRQFPHTWSLSLQTQKLIFNYLGLKSF